MTSVVYLMTTALTLLMLGRLSDHLGRKPVALAALAISAVGCLVLTGIHSPMPLMTGRILQGISCGLALAALAPCVVDTAPVRFPWLAGVITGVVVPFAVPVGALISGALASFAPAPRVLGLLLCLGAVILCAAFLMACPESSPRRRGALRSILPRVKVPRDAVRTFIAVAGGVGATWAVGGYYLSFSPVVAADGFGVDDTLLIAVLFSSLSLLNPLAGIVTARFKAVTTFRISLVFFASGVICIAGAMSASLLELFLALSYATGAAFGAVAAAGTRALLAVTPAMERAGMLSTLYLASYAGAAVPNAVGSALSPYFTVTELLIGYCVLVVVLTAVALTLTRFSRT